MNYTTVFPTAEDPVNESGAWINAGLVALDWYNCSVSPAGFAHGNQTPDVPQYTDPQAILNGGWRSNQFATAVVYATSPTNTEFQEVELHLRNTFSAHNTTGYEVAFRCLKTAEGYMSIARGDGVLGNFAVLLHLDGAQYGVQTGDVVLATIVGSVITAYINGVQVAQVTDGTYTSGSPGMGFNYGVSTTNADFGFTSFTAGEIAYSLMGASG